MPTKSIRLMGFVTTCRSVFGGGRTTAASQSLWGRRHVARGCLGVLLVCLIVIGRGRAVVADDKGQVPEARPTADRRVTLPLLHQPPAPPDDNPDAVFPFAIPSASNLRGTSRFIPGSVGGSLWVAQGPGPTTNGQVENIIPNNEVVGAVHVVAAHPTDPNILFLGGANGGIWGTPNATAASPTWFSLTDGLPSLSIGALVFDPTDATHNTLVAGVGRFSSFGSAGGSRIGLLRTADGGSTWAVLDGGGTLINSNISGVAARGSTLVASVNFAVPFTFPKIGIFRSIDGGASFAQISQGSGGLTGLPGGLAYDLASDPTNNSILYTSMVFADSVGGVNGIYKSADTGATWTRVSNAAMDALLISGTTSNVEIAVGNAGQVYVAILNSGQLRNGGVFRSGDGGATWLAMDIPLTNETGGSVGTNPTFKTDAGVPGSQGSIHFSIVADPVNSNLVYVGGDRQPAGFNDQFGFPNGIGAFDFSGRLFRGDASLPTGSQWVHLTHSNALGAPGGGTANSTAPHADSREMVFDANGNLIECDDGGVYRRTSPQNNTGDWFSIIGNLQSTEFHDIAYDSNANIIIGGAQDTGTPQQNTPGGKTWRSISTADGGDVAVDDVTLAGLGRSIRYSSFQFLISFQRLIWDSNNNFVSGAFPNLIVAGQGGQNLSQVDSNIQFAQPIELNRVTPARGLIGTQNLYETFNQFDDLTDITGPTGATITAMAYGGTSGGIPNADVIYFGTSAPSLSVRTTLAGAVSSLSAYPGSTPLDIVLDVSDWQTAYVVDPSQVFQTTDTGTTWTNITGDLTGAGTLWSVEFIAGVGDFAVVVGADSGVFFSLGSALGTWNELGSNLPNAPVRDLDYDAADDLLLAGTLGRGAWTVPSVGAAIFVPACACLGDVNGDTFINGLDTQMFVDCLLGTAGPGANCGCADFTGLNGPDPTDIPSFVAALVSGAVCGP